MNWWRQWRLRRSFNRWWAGQGYFHDRPDVEAASWAWWQYLEKLGEHRVRELLNSGAFDADRHPPRGDAPA